MFMKCEGENFIINGFSVDYMMHILTSERLNQEFMGSFHKTFKVMSGDLTSLETTFLGLELEQTDSSPCTSTLAYTEWQENTCDK